MIEVTHRIDIDARCPVNGAEDKYECDITVYRTVPVEHIKNAVESLTRKPIFQEELTEQLAQRFLASVVTRGYHGNVHTICRSEG